MSKQKANSATLAPTFFRAYFDVSALKPIPEHRVGRPARPSLLGEPAEPQIDPEHGEMFSEGEMWVELPAKKGTGMDEAAHAALSAFVEEVAELEPELALGKVRLTRIVSMDGLPQVRTYLTPQELAQIRMCRACGCMATDCSQCVERSGDACDWAARDLCTVCHRLGFPLDPAAPFVPAQASIRRRGRGAFRAHELLTF